MTQPTKITEKELAILDTIRSKTGRDFSRNRAIVSYMRHGLNFKVAKKLFWQVFQPITDERTARAATLISANMHLNGGQIPGFGSNRGVLYPYEQIEALVNSSKQAKSTLDAIKPETLQAYLQATDIIDKEKAIAEITKSTATELR